MPAAVTTLFEQIGGGTAVKAVVEEFYKRVLADVDLKGFFAQTDMDKQTQQQIKFITMALGGPNDYDGQSMKDAHQGMSITETHFNKVAGHLVESLQWAGVEQKEIDEIVAVVGPLQADIVG